MPLALCLECGAMKTGPAWSRCPECGYRPAGLEALTRQLALSYHYRCEEELLDLAGRFRAGEPWPADLELQEELRDWVEVALPDLPEELREAP